jgi:hypothetical protein
VPPAAIRKLSSSKIDKTSSNLRAEPSLKITSSIEKGLTIVAGKSPEQVQASQRASNIKLLCGSPVAAISSCSATMTGSSKQLLIDNSNPSCWSSEAVIRMVNVEERMRDKDDCSDSSNEAMSDRSSPFGSEAEQPLFLVKGAKVTNILFYYILCSHSFVKILHFSSDNGYSTGTGRYHYVLC